MRSLTAVVAAALVLLPAAPAWAAGSPPVAVDDAVNIRGAAGIDFLVGALANDTDPDGDTLTYTAVTAAGLGTSSIQSGRLFYRPTLGIYGTDSFTYTISDGQGNTSTATVTVTVWKDSAAPTSLAISGSGLDSATVTWAASTDAVSYRVYRNGLLVTSTSGLTFTDNSLMPASSFRYEVAALNGGGFEGPHSSLVYRWPQMSTPTGLAVDLTDDPTALSVSWSSGGLLGPWNLYRDGVLLTSSTTSSFTDTGLVTGREYSYQVQRPVSSTTVALYPASALSPAVRATPSALSPINQLFWDLGWTSGTMGPITVPERAIPGGRQQDHTRGLILQQDGEGPFTVRIGNAPTYAAAGGATGDLGFPLAEADCSLRDYGCGQFFEGGSIWYQQLTGTRVVRAVIEEGWAAAGWEDGPLGYPAGNQGVLPRGGLWQAFEDGAVYWSAATGSHGVSGAIGDLYRSTGATAGGLGYPVTDEDCGIRDDGCYQQFQSGTVYWSPDSEAHAVSGAMRTAWARAGSEWGRLGYPTGEQTCGLRDGGCSQQFQGGAISISPATGTRLVLGDIRDAWAAYGMQNSGLGYPTTDEVCGIRDGGCYQQFQGAAVYWSSASGAHLVHGAVGAAWTRTGSEWGLLGFPTTDENCGLRDGGCSQQFQGGAVYWSPASGSHLVHGAIRAAWVAGAAQNGGLGYPTTDVVCGIRDGGCYQQFQGGYVYTSAASGTHLLYGGIRSAWARTGSEWGLLGYPTSDENCGLRDGGCSQQFQGGAVYWSPASGAHLVHGAIRDAWAANGLQNGLGYPTTDVICGLRDGGCYQLFQGATIYSAPAAGTHVVLGGIRDIWVRTGSEWGRLGYPTTDESFSAGAYRQTFLGGSITVTNGAVQIAYR